MILATELQQLLQVEDGVIIAHGYTFERDTIDVYFEEGKIVRCTTKGYGPNESYNYTIDLTFDANTILFMEAKRYYKDRTNAKLISLCESFGRPLSLV